MKRGILTMIGFAIAVGVTGCGGGDETTVIKESPAPAVKTTTTTTTAKAQEASQQATPVQDTTTEAQSEPPDVEGLSLPEAKRQLADAGFRADVSNTDTTFGIIIPENFTVCRQSEPKGEVVPILAQKYGC